MYAKRIHYMDSTMSDNVKHVDIIGDIAAITGLKLDIVQLVLTAHELVILDKVLEGQLDASDDTDYVILGNLIIDSTNYPNIKIKGTNDLESKINEVVKTARDYLSEAVISKFNSDLIKTYSGKPLYDHDPAISVGDNNE